MMTTKEPNLPETAADTTTMTMATPEIAEIMTIISMTTNPTKQMKKLSNQMIITANHVMQTSFVSTVQSMMIASSMAFSDS